MTFKLFDYEVTLRNILFIDLIIHIVDKRTTPTEYTRLATIEKFAERVAMLTSDETFKNNQLVQDVIEFVQKPSKYNILQPKEDA